jgi:putative restriction endonuclease
VDDYWQETGRSGFRIWRYRLIKMADSAAYRESVSETRGIYSVASRQEITVQRVVRNTGQAQRLKALDNYKCQVCKIRLEGLAGPYAEAAHIRPLGAPHDGPDTLDNMLCLCPNHHVLLDHGGIAIDENLWLIGEERSLLVHRQHPINEEHLRSRREHYRSLSKP